MHNDSEMTTDERIDNLVQRFEELVKRIDLLSRGDQSLGMKGYSQRIENNEENILQHERRMNEIDNRFQKVYQRVMGICVGVTIAVSVVGWWIENSVQIAEANPIPKVEYVKPVPLSVPIPEIPLEYVPEDSTNEK